jgi:hypothetical protein
MVKLTQSLLNMAEAMLEDEYKSSHTDLKEWGDENEKKEMEKECQQEQVEEKELNTNPDEETRQDTSDEKKSEIRSVVIQVPPKRRKISNAFTAGEVVDGKFLFMLNCLRILMRS